MAKSSKKGRRESDFSEEKMAELREIARARIGLGDRHDTTESPATAAGGRPTGDSSPPTKAT